MSADNRPLDLHPDFAGMHCAPGESHITDRPELFALLNVAAFGGAADRPTHVPRELARLGSTVVWESTGSSDALPFWNTNEQADAWLYLVHGSVRIEFKAPESPHAHGFQLARTGDLLKLPRDVAHRTFSGDGRRRISLELLEHNPHWDLIGRRPIEPDESGTAGGFAFELLEEHVRVHWPGGSLLEPRPYFTRALRALVAYELHLYHNEFLGGLIVHDFGDEVSLKAGGYVERLPNYVVVNTFAGLLARLREPVR